MGMSSKTFWDLSFPEFRLALDGWKYSREVRKLDRLMNCWYNGFHSQTDLKKHSIDNWLDLIDPDNAEERLNKKVEHHKAEREKVWASLKTTQGQQ